ncbi:hypothetical protein AVEN_8244-1 [Araneus ventricosus]|uniref:Uncharacterized protein n=1 Tax=Araneus ventricosus TaxID=182803 RepID=A0A4Y2L2I5_ARAVE|nr:hypothetical protein AVEN_8244-1 [Araneus ventricosus]
MSGNSGPTFHHHGAQQGKAAAPALEISATALTLLLARSALRCPPGTVIPFNAKPKVTMILEQTSHAGCHAIDAQGPKCTSPVNGRHLTWGNLPMRAIGKQLPASHGGSLIPSRERKKI